MSRWLALTGGSGFIGGALIPYLLASGYQLRVLYRRPLPQDVAELPGVHPIQGDLADRTSLVPLVAGVDAIVHCAGRVRARRRAEFFDGNVSGLANLLAIVTQQAPRATGVAISSLAAKHPDLSPYAASKEAAEKLLRTTFGGLNWTILRPPAVYGPGDRELEPLWKTASRGCLIVPGSGRRRFSLLHVADLCAAIVAVLNEPGETPGTYELHDGKPGGHSWVELAAIISQIRGADIRKIMIPASLLKLICALNLGVGWLVNYAPMLTPAKMREILHPDWVCDNTRFTEVFEWSPRWPLERGVTEAVGPIRG